MQSVTYSNNSKPLTMKKKYMQKYAKMQKKKRLQQKMPMFVIFWHRFTFVATLTKLRS
jgi:hypothetical protein